MQMFLVSLEQALACGRPVVVDVKYKSKLHPLVTFDVVPKVTRVALQRHELNVVFV